MLLRHEYGHWLQYRDVNFLNYYKNYALPSIIHYLKNPDLKTYLYMRYPPERDANNRSYIHFNSPSDWDGINYPTYTKQTQNPLTHNKIK